MEKARKDTLAGVVFIAFGLAFAIGALNYDLGSAMRMGPGYVPLSLGCALIVLGVLVIAEGVVRGEGTPVGGVPWRAVLLLVAAIVFFGFMVRRLGLAPAIFVSSVMASYSSRDMRAPVAIAIATALAAFCTLIFVKALGLPVPILGAWLRF